MATYRAIRGFTIQSLDSDPIISVAASGTWAAGGSMPTATNNMASFGTQTAAMSAGGYYPTGLTATSFTYNGTSWSPIQALQESPTKYGRRGCGTTTAGLVFGGIPPVSTATEEWGGSSWTAGGSLSTARYNLGAAGTQTAGLAMGGNQDPPPVSSACEEYDGSSWTAGGSLNTARNGLAGVGVQTLALAIGGSTGSDTAAVEQYDGSSWTEIADLNTARNNISSARNGVVGSALAFGGHDTAATGKTETYDGTSWTELSDLATARGDLGGAGVLTAAVAFGGEEPSRSTATEEFTTASPPYTLAQEGQVWYNTSSNTVKGFGAQGTGSWASGAAVANPRPAGTGQGTVDAALIEGGGNTTNTESFDGTSWTEVNDLNTGRTENSGAGSQTAALYFGGNYPPGALTEEWDGTSWTEVADLNYGRYGQGGSGTTTAAMCVGGERPGAGYRAETEEFDGTSWTEVADLNTARAVPTNFGTTTASICSSGQPEPGGNTESWNGTAWTEVNNQVTGRKNKQQSGFGLQTLGMVYGGNKPAAYDTLTETWDGTNWAAGADLAQARAGCCGAGTTTASALAIAGYPTPAVGTSVEQWTLAPAVKAWTAS